MLKKKVPSKKARPAVSIGKLPEEMQAYILSKLDGKTSAVAKRVCRLWRNLLYGMESCMHFWLRKCVNEIPAHALVELSRLMYISSRREETMAELGIDWRSCCPGNLPWMFWREVYAEYYRCGYIVEGAYKKTELHFFPLYGEVTCLYMQDNDIFTGHESGAVMCWSNIEGELSSEILYRHERRVTCIDGIDRVSTVKNALNGDNNSKIVSSSKDSTLIVHCMEPENTKTIKHYTKTVNCVRSWGDRFIAAADKSMIQGQPIWRSPDSGSIDTDTSGGIDTDVTCTLYTEEAPNVKTVAFWEDTVISGDESGDLYFWTEDTEGKTSTTRHEMVPIASLGSSVNTLFLLGSRVIALTGDKHLHIGSKNIREDQSFTSLNIYSAIQKTPECMNVRASILAIGCKGGSVFLYHVPTDESWESLDLSHPAETVNVTVDHINDIAISDDGGGPVIVLATSGYCICVLQFRLRKHLPVESRVPT